jgi:HAD superfamily hydrolase (TIGR01549 family)
VLVESVEVKTHAFAELFRPYGDEVVAQVVAYHLVNGGISRFEKFRYFFRELIRQPLSKETERQLGIEFSKLVETKVVAAPWVKGAEAFLKAWHNVLPLFIASGTPEEELKRIVEKRGMNCYFCGVCGSPRGKEEILRQVIAENGFASSRVLMVGDALSDLEAALLADTAFVGRVDAGQPQVFHGKGVRVITDLTELPALI